MNIAVMPTDVESSSHEAGERIVNVIACTRRRDAESLIAILGLDPRLWFAMEIGEPLLGHRFDKAIVFHKVSPSLTDEASSLQWICNLATKARRVLFP